MKKVRITLALIGFGHGDLSDPRKPIIAFRCAVPDEDLEDFGRFLRMIPFGPGVEVLIHDQPDDPVVVAGTPPPSEPGRTGP